MRSSPAASSTPPAGRTFLEDRSAPLQVTCEYKGETHTLDDYVERNQVAALLVLAGDVIVHARFRLGAGRGTRWRLRSASPGTSRVLALLCPLKSWSLHQIRGDSPLSES